MTEFPIEFDATFGGDDVTVGAGPATLDVGAHEPDTSAAEGVTIQPDAAGQALWTFAMDQHIGCIPAAAAGYAKEEAVWSGIYLGEAAPEAEFSSEKQPVDTREYTPSYPTGTRDAAPGPVETDEEHVAVPDREVKIGDMIIESDVDVLVSAGTTSYPTAEIHLYNLSVRTWNSIASHDSIHVDAGWKGHDLMRVFTGKVKIKRKERQRGDHDYVVKAIGAGGDTVNGRVAQTFQNVSPHQMVKHLIKQTDGLKKGHVSNASKRVTGSFVIDGSKKLRDWLDALADLAERQTQRRWVWYVDDGKLSFHPRTERATDVVSFRMGDSMLVVSPTGELTRKNTSSSQEITTRMEPIIRRGLCVRLEDVGHIEPDELFRVRSYNFETSTTKGRHHTQAVVEPLTRRLHEIDEATPR